MRIFHSVIRSILLIDVKNAQFTMENVFKNGGETETPQIYRNFDYFRIELFLVMFRIEKVYFATNIKFK